MWHISKKHIRTALGWRSDMMQCNSEVDWIHLHFLLLPLTHKHNKTCRKDSFQLQGLAHFMVTQQPFSAALEQFGLMHFSTQPLADIHSKSHIQLLNHLTRTSFSSQELGESHPLCFFQDDCCRHLEFPKRVILDSLWTYYWPYLNAHQIAANQSRIGRDMLSWICYSPILEHISCQWSNDQLEFDTEILRFYHCAILAGNAYSRQFCGLWVIWPPKITTSLF